MAISEPLNSNRIEFRGPPLPPLGDDPNAQSASGSRKPDAAVLSPALKTLTGVHRGLPTLRETEKLHGWVYQTTRRAIADFYRTPSQNREVATGTVEGIANELAGDDSPEGDEAATRELSTCLRPLMRGLTAADQEALQMVEFDGVTQVEAAARLGLSVSGMKSRTQRARSHLRSALHDCCRIAVDRRGGVISYEGKSKSCDSCAPESDSTSGCS